VLESTCEGVDKEVERGLDDLFEGEFLTEEFVIEEFTKQTFKVIWL
jgi:predicted transcriptional regulator